MLDMVTLFTALTHIFEYGLSSIRNGQCMCVVAGPVMKIARVFSFGIHIPHTQ